MISHKWGKPAKMDGDVGLVESGDQEMYRKGMSHKQQYLQ